jgi:hypothetical protein
MKMGDFFHPTISGKLLQNPTFLYNAPKSLWRFSPSFSLRLSKPPMENQIVTFAVIGAYSVLFAVVWAVFEKRLKVIHRRHVEKCQPFGQRGLERIDTNLKRITRGILLLLLVLSLSTIYLMMS